MDPTILDGMTIPEGLDLDTLKNNIILECAELEVLYGAPSFFRWAVDAWSLKESPTWEKMYAALQIEYNPIENYDRFEEWTETGKQDTNKTVKNKTSVSGTNTDNGDVRHYVTGYNSNSEVLQSRDNNDSTSTNKTDVTGDGAETETAARNDTRKGRIHGNIGVTTSQQMLKAEFDLAPDVNMYNIITNSFRNRFCLLIY